MTWHIWFKTRREQCISPSIKSREHTKIDLRLASLRRRYFAGGLSAIVSDVTLSLWLDLGDDGYDK
jgi:hypothetical protein